MNILCFAGGLLLGGGAAIAVMCCFQAARISEYEEIIRGLQEKEK